MRVMLGNEVEHLHEMLVVVKRRQRTTLLHGNPVRLIEGHGRNVASASRSGYGRCATVSRTIAATRSAHSE